MVLAVVVALAAFGGVVAYFVHRNQVDHEIKSNYTKIAALEKGSCFVPSGDGTDDDAILRVGSCTDATASVRVTAIVKDSDMCATSEGNRSMGTVRNDGTSAEHDVCVTVNFVLGRCYTQDASPTLLGLVDCTDARNNPDTYYVPYKNAYTSEQIQACDKFPSKAFRQPDREGATCVRIVS